MSANNRHTSAEEIIKALDLMPHPEGGYYRETYRSAETIPHDDLPSRYVGDRSFSTAIYYLLTRESFSALHRVQSDEIFHFYVGHPVELLLLSPTGEAQTVTVGSGIHLGERPQIRVPRGVWQGLRLTDEEPSNGEASTPFVLLGATVAPGFDFTDFEMAERDELLRAFPDWSELIIKFTR